MILLYKYQEQSDTFIKNIQHILQKIQNLAQQGTDSQNADQIKSAFMLTEAMFSVHCD